MKLVALSLAIALAVGYLLGGRLSRLSDLQLRWAPLALVGLLLQVLEPPGSWPLVLLTASFVLLIVFAIANIRTVGFPIVLAGIVLNVTVIAVNGGMPVTRDAIVASGQSETLRPLLEHRSVKHHLADEDDRLLFLGDVIAVPPPIGQVLSVGDILMYGGVAVVVVVAMRRRPRRVPTTMVGAIRVHV